MEDRTQPAAGRRILGIVASLRPGGNSEALVKTALEAAEETGAQADIVFLADLDIRFCDGCLSCVFKGTGCHHADDVHWLFSAAAGYDGIILGSGTYNLGAPGQVKTLVDRGVGELPTSFGRREIPVGTICVAGLPGWDYLVRPMVNQLALLLGGRLTGGVMAYAPGPAEALLDEEVVRDVRDLGRAVASDRDFPAPPGVCPVCHLPQGEGQTCPFCLATEEHAGPGSGRDAGHRFTGASLARFLVEWMLPTRERYLAHRSEVKKAAAALPDFASRRLRPDGRPGRREA